MEGLVDIRVRCAWTSRQPMGDRERDFLGPLWSVKRQLRIFEVGVPWAAGDGEVETEELKPFVLKRVGN